MHRWETPQFVHVVDIPTALDLRTKLKQREAAILADMDENEALVIEYHSPAGTVVRIRDIGYYQDSDNTLVLGGWDRLTGDECQIIASPATIHLVFRVIKIEEDEARLERRQLGFIQGPELAQPPT